MGRQAPKRGLNQCLDCYYEWHPRGKMLSLRCPSCSSENVRVKPYNWMGFFVVVLALAGGWFYLSGDLSPESVPERNQVEYSSNH